MSVITTRLQLSEMHSQKKKEMITGWKYKIQTKSFKLEMLLHNSQFSDRL